MLVYDNSMGVEIYSVLNISIGVFMAQVAYTLASMVVGAAVLCVKPKQATRPDDQQA